MLTQLPHTTPIQPQTQPSRPLTSNRAMKSPPRHYFPSAAPPTVVPFPTKDRWGSADDARLAALRADATSLVCLERAGDSADGVCYTMRAYPMGPTLLGPLNTLASEPAGLRVIGIGDGGNELGMGELHTQIVESVHLGAARAAPGLLP